MAAAPTATMAPMSEQRAAEEAFRFLRGHTTCEIRFDEQYLPLRYVIEPGGRLVAPVSGPMLEAADSVLFVPSNEDHAMEIQVTLSELDPDGPDGAFTDRWRIYHGEPQEARWAAFDFDAARYGKCVIDGPVLMRSNPLAADEARLCRRINQQRRGDLVRACKHVADADVEQPMLVGIDPLGFDVRRRFDIVRLPAHVQMETAETVERVFELMVTGDG